MSIRSTMAALACAALSLPASGAVLSGPGAPTDPARRLLVVGQDLDAVSRYVRSARFPTPSGVTGYISLWGLNSPANPAYGGLGLSPTDSLVGDVGWGAGPVNARNTGVGYPNSALVLGVYMTEEFCPGCLTRTAQGGFDPEIRRLARFVKSMGKPVFLRIGYEFDGPWNKGYENAEAYKAAWRRIADTLHALAPNAITVLQAATSPVGVDRDPELWYPGDAYVDWVGFSWFLSGHPRQAPLADKVLSLARKHGKPVMVAESSPQGYDLANLSLRAINRIAGESDPRLASAPGTPLETKTVEQIWTEWYEPFLGYIETNRDAIRAVAYIDCQWDAQPKWGAPYAEGYWGDSRLEANDAMASRWNAELAKPRWLHGSAHLFDSLQSRGNLNPPPVLDTDSVAPVIHDRPWATRTGLGQPGHTTLLIGQTFVTEYDAYRRAMGVPAGSSHYGELYNGRINQGDDGATGHPRAHLEFVDGLQDSAIVQVALSWKDNPDLSTHPRDECGDFIGKRVYQVNQDIASGFYDAQIDSIAAIFAAKPQVTFLLRIEYEVSRFAFSWKPSAACPQPGRSVDFSDPSIIDDAPYKDAFRHVALRLRDVRKLTNVRTVYHPVRGIGDAKGLYPGSDVVDFVALSLFADDVCYGDHNCQGLIDQNARAVFQWARDSLHKPRMVAECSWQPLSTTDPSRRAWAASAAGMVDYLQRLRSIVDTFDVSVVSYINSDWRSHGWDTTWWGDSRVEARATVSDWWKAHVAADPRFLGGRLRGTSEVHQARTMANRIWARQGGWELSQDEGPWSLHDSRGTLLALGRGTSIPAAGLKSGPWILRTRSHSRILVR